jgi:hypothetical protein
MTWSEIVWVISSIKCAIETRETFAYRINSFRDVDETDIETLDRLLKELVAFRSGAKK